MSVSHETTDLDSEWKGELRRLLGFAVPDDRLDYLSEKLTLFAREILKANSLLHLVSQRNPAAEVLKQIIDSAAVASFLSLCPGCRLLDVGSGAGFPGIVLKQIFPKIELHSLDSSPRKIAFQKAICSRLGTEATFHTGDFRRLRTERQVDIAVVKALGSHAEVLKRSRSWLRPKGKLIFMEGRSPDPTIEISVQRTNTYSHVQFSKYTLPGFDSARHLAIAYRK